MQKNSLIHTEEKSDDRLIPILRKAYLGNSNAKFEIISLFEDEIDGMCKFVKMPKEDAKQSLIAV